MVYRMILTINSNSKLVWLSDHEIHYIKQGVSQTFFMDLFLSDMKQTKMEGVLSIINFLSFTLELDKFLFFLK